MRRRSRLRRRAVDPPGLYLHLPFCARVCPYCDFAVAVGSAPTRQRFVEALLTEIALGAPAEIAAEGPAGGAAAPAGNAPRAPATSDRLFDTIYLGGGTPSLLAVEQLARILEAIRRHLPVAAAAAVTLEANPEDLSRESLRAWRGLGIDRLSLGVQSFDDAALAFLGRLHDAAVARRAVELALGGGLDWVSLDLIYGLPGQTDEALARELAAAVELAPQHLSCYQLTVEPGSVFGHRQRQGQLEELPGRRQAVLFRAVHRRLAEAGYAAYEVSNFAAAPEHRSRHNEKYWAHVPYLGLGPSAHSFDGRARWWNVRKPGPYRLRLLEGGRPVAGREELTAGELALERLMLGLRRPQGVDPAVLLDATGYDLLACRAGELAALRRSGLIEPGAGRVRPTLEGLAMADTLARELAPRSAGELAPIDQGREAGALG